MFLKKGIRTATGLVTRLEVRTNQILLEIIVIEWTLDPEVVPPDIQGRPSCSWQVLPENKWLLSAMTVHVTPQGFRHLFDQWMSVLDRPMSVGKPSAEAITCVLDDIWVRVQPDSQRLPTEAM